MYKKNIRIGARNYELESDDNYLQALGEAFEPQTVALLKSLQRSQGVVIDIGANIGCTALLFAQQAARVLAFEPSPSTFSLLKRNIETSGCKNIELFNMALGREAGRSELTFAPDNRSGAFVSDQTQASVGHVTETITIERLDDVVATLALNRIDLIKIDVEGFEQSVLQGSLNTLARYRPVVVLELNHWCLNAFQRITVPDFFDFLRSIFPVLHAVDGDSRLDLHDASQSYMVMYHHILHFKYQNIVASF
jgi:FkbM family methyltransferase